MILVILSLKENIIEKKKREKVSRNKPLDEFGNYTLERSYSLEALARCEKC